MIGPESVKVSSVELVAVRPEGHDLERVRFLRGQAQVAAPPREAMFVAKVTMPVRPVVTSEAFELYVGDTQVEKYFGYRNGVYFKIYDTSFLAKHSGAPIRIGIPGVGKVETGVRFPGGGGPRPETTAPEGESAAS